MNQKFLSVVLGSALATAAVSTAQPPMPPELQNVSAQRNIAAGVDADGVGQSNQDADTEAGPFVGNFAEVAAGPEGSISTASASQNSYISTFSIHGIGEVEAGAVVSPTGSVASSGFATLSISFSIPVDANFEFSGTLDSSVDVVGLARAEVSLSGIFLNDFPFAYQKFSQPDTGPGSEGEVEFDVNTETVGQVSVKANSPVFLLVQAQAIVGAGATGPMSGLASFEFSFDFGDRDLDGLLDVWEEEGIDVDNDGTPEIDLPGYGADPDRKDIFVEIDAMEGSVVGDPDLEKVHEAFRLAPSDLVYNPVPQTFPIELHVVGGVDLVPDAPLVADPWPLEFDLIKDEYFGSPADRNHPMTDEILAARRKIVRYCLLAVSLVNEQGKSIAGRAEGAPGNDFIVNLKGISDRFSEASPSTLNNAFEGTFMHELGHALGLLDGGTDEILFKPNYLSTMNFLYMTPIGGVTVQGTPKELVWWLDFNRGARTVDELSLVETPGIGGDHGRLALFNIAPFPDPPVASLARAYGPDIDWDNSGPPSDTTPYPLDISRIRSFDPESYDRLESPTDWDRLWFHLSGHPNFDDRLPRVTATSPSGVEFELLDELESMTWIDQTALTPEIFWDDFENGRTSAWSSTAP